MDIVKVEYVNNLIPVKETSVTGGLLIRENNELGALPRAGANFRLIPNR